MKIEHCPKCATSGTLYEDRSIQATINNQWVGHVAHEQFVEGVGTIRWACQLRRTDLDTLKKEISQMTTMKGQTTMTTYTYYEYNINPHHAGFGEYEAGPLGDEFVDENDILQAFAEAGQDMFELGNDALPDGIEDIRGKIRYPATHYGTGSDRIFVFLDENGAVTYRGITTREPRLFQS